MRPLVTTLLPLSLCLLALACEKSDTGEDGVFVKREILWTADRIDGGRPKVIGDVQPNAAWADHGIALVAGADPETSKLLALDLETGERRWEWADQLGSPDTEGISMGSCARSGDTILYTVGTRVYAINLATGQTIWRARPEITFNSNDLAGDTPRWYGCAVAKEGPQAGDRGLFEGRFSGPSFELITTAPPPSLEAHPGFEPEITSVEVLPAPDNHLIALVYQIVVPGIRFARERVSFLGLYDRAAGTWVYDDVRLNDPSASNGVALSPARLHDGTIYVAIGTGVYAHDVWSGERKWSQQFRGEIWTSGLTVAEGLCVVNCEDKWLYGFDAETGVRRWGLPSAQLSTELEGRVLDGVVYWVGRSEASLFAADLRTGQLLWRLRADAVLGRDVLFNANLYAVPGRDGRPGRIVALAGETVVCFEAHR